MLQCWFSGKWSGFKTFVSSTDFGLSIIVEFVNLLFSYMNRLPLRVPNLFIYQNNERAQDDQTYDHPFEGVNCRIL